MCGPRQPNEVEMELLIQKKIALFPDYCEPYTEEGHRDYDLSLLGKSYVALFDSWFFWDSVENINYLDMSKLLVVFWPHRPDFFAAFTLTHDNELILVRQSDVMREMETKSSTCQ